MVNREAFTPLDIVKDIWTHLDLPPAALSSLSLPGLNGAPAHTRPAVRSSFKIGHLAQSTIALSALGAAVVHSIRDRSHPFPHPSPSPPSSSSLSSSSSPESKSKLKILQRPEIPKITVPLRPAVLEFHCERLYTLSGNPPISSWGPIGGLHPTADGSFVRIHDVFPHLRTGALALLGLSETCTDRGAVSERTKLWEAGELETVAVERRGLAVYKLRDFGEWDWGEQARAVGELPVAVRRVGVVPSSSHSSSSASVVVSANSPHRTATTDNKVGSGPQKKKRCLSNLRVLELSRVIAAPVAGKTLAAHGADVLWVTSPNLPDLPALDCEFARGKRSIQLDLSSPSSDPHTSSSSTSSPTSNSDINTLLSLARTADVILQSYRPGSLASRVPGLLDAEELGKANPGVIIANLSAFGPTGPWKDRRGFDSLVQTCSGIAVAEAERWNLNLGKDENEKERVVARQLPCQALDHAAGYLLATGICAALYHRERDRAEGRSVAAYVVDVSLAGVGKYLRSLGQFEGREGFEEEDCSVLGREGRMKEEVDEEEAFFETRMSAFGEMTFLRHSATVEGFGTGWERMPARLGKDEPVWLAA